MKRLHTVSEDRFGAFAERFANFLGSSFFIGLQSLIVLIWIAINICVVTLQWDAYPFILLNLAFSTQAAYAAPLILLATKRQSERDKEREISEIKHREEIALAQRAQLDAIQQQIAELQSR